MLTRSMKLVSIAALLLAVLFWNRAPATGLALRFIVSLSAFLVVRQAILARRWYWAAGFLVPMVLFNPFAAVIPFSGDRSLFLVIATMGSFVVSLRDLRTQPLLSVPSITDRTPGSASL